ncbi:MAG: cytochrome c [Woeseiaceae bacterium]|nr:cytochrome c [Woeseiaceae bacterium]
MRLVYAYSLAVMLMLGLLIPLQASADTQNPEMSGRALYVRYQCWQCHGYEGQGGAGPRVATMQYPFDAFIRFVRFPNEMPAYSKELLSDDEVRRIFDFLASIPVPPEIKDIPALRD